MRIAVTAATGQLGGAILTVLKQTPGVTPIAVARTPARAAALGVEARLGDYDDQPQLEAAFAGVDSVLFVSGMAPPAQRIFQHRRVIDAARRSGVKHVVYTGVVVNPGGDAFAAIQRMSLETERYLKESGLAFTIGRNGIYIEPDLEYIEEYARAGKIRNSAGDGRCAYTLRSELAQAYARLLTDPRHHGQTYTLAGPPITQAELAAAINAEYGTTLRYEPMSIEAYRQDRIAELGDFLGPLIAGIYEGIRKGAMDVTSEFAQIVGRPHLSPAEMIRAFRAAAAAEKAQHDGGRAP